MNYPKVNKEQARAFSKVWNKGGVAILLDETALDFAKDFANVVLMSFIDESTKAAKKAAEAAAKLAEQSKTGIIIEG